MFRFLQRASGPAGSSPFDALPDELLLAVFQLVPEITLTPPTLLAELTGR